MFTPSFYGSHVICQEKSSARSNRTEEIGSHHWALPHLGGAAIPFSPRLLAVPPFRAVKIIRHSRRGKEYCPVAKYVVN